MSAELRNKRAELLKKANRIIDVALTQNRALRPAESGDLDAIESQIAAIDRTLKAQLLFATMEADGPAATGLVDSLRALSANNATSGGYAVPTPMVQEVIEALRPLTAVRSLGPRVLPMPSGNFTWPKITGGIQVGYLNEGVILPVVEQRFGGFNLTGRKLAATVPISNSLLRMANPLIDRGIRDDLAAAVAQAEDLAFLRGDGTAWQPRGLRYWAPAGNLIAANASVSLANTDADLGKLETALLNANVSLARGGWIMAPRVANYLRNLRGTGGDKAYPEMASGMLRGKPFRETTAVPVNLGTGSDSEIYLANFDDAAIGDATFEISLARNAAYTVAGQMIHGFQLDQSVYRVVSTSDIGCRHAESVAVLVGVTWA